MHLTATRDYRTSLSSMRTSHHTSLMTLPRNAPFVNSAFARWHFGIVHVHYIESDNVPWACCLGVGSLHRYI